ncbi:2Fe-2S ferredoxin [Buchnera aphidicola (Eriosoma grossulariae)]|uniref:ISC system 2Fe-2S type ferredoxin n=1 Tax=Buchnera aphidicola TaxID=9 RepID=UPI0034639189
MPIIKFLYYEKKILKNLIINVKSGQTILDVALSNNISMEHACEKSCACSTCHCIIKKGFNSLSKITEKEEDLLDKAWGLNQFSRLGCQAKIGKENIEVEIPIYTINHSKKY